MTSTAKLEYRTLAESQLDVICIENQYCEAIIAKQGAQILQYRLKSSNGRPDKTLLWLSQHLPQQGQKAIRGGIPLCFPWFGAHPVQPNLPAHGFARTEIWTLEHIQAEAHQHNLTFSLQSDEHTKTNWNHDFQLKMTIHCGEDLSLTLSVHNTGITPFTFSFAWHSYFAVSDIHDTQILGLENTAYIDQLHQQNPHRQTEPSLSFSAETDRIYYQTQGHYCIQDPLQQIKIDSPDCPDAVVWNPWANKAARLADMQDHAWLGFVCLESGQIHTPVQLPAQHNVNFHMHITADLL